VPTVPAGGRFAGTWRIEAVDPHRAQVIFRYHLDARPRCLSCLL